MPIYRIKGYDDFQSDIVEIKRSSEIEMNSRIIFSLRDDLKIQCILKNAYEFWNVKHSHEDLAEKLRDTTGKS